MTAPTTEAEPTYLGRSFRYELPSGWSFLLTFAAKNLSDATDTVALRMAGLTGPFAGEVADFDVTAARVAPGVYFLNWIKPDGDSVSHVHDYNTHTVHAFWATTVDGVRTGRFTTGTLVEQ